MSGSASHTEVNGELEPAERAAAAPAQVSVLTPLPRSAAPPAPSMARPLSPAALPLGRATESSPIDRIQFVGNRALIELSYQMRRVGSTTLVGSLALVTAAIVFVVSNLPQGAAVRALRSEITRPVPPVHGAAPRNPTGAMLAALPARAEAPGVVAKILEEARASGVELPRGQYQYVPPRDGVAARYRMTFPVHASYPQIREFMNRTLVALPAVAIEGLRIERKNVGEDSVDAELKLSAYVRSDP